MKNCVFCGTKIWTAPFSKEVLCKTCYVPIMIILKKACEDIKKRFENIHNTDHPNVTLETLSDLEERVLILKNVYFSKGIKIEGVNINQLLINIQKLKFSIQGAAY